MNGPLTEQIQRYPQTGEVLDGKYQIESMLGEGGMGAVARAQHLLRRAPVALKFMSPAILTMAGAVERFVNEAVAASQIDSDHVVKIFDVGKLPSGAPYLVMEFLQGEDLAQLHAREGRPYMDTPRAIHFVLQILRGLQVAHSAGIVHRDMKPSNVFVVQKEGERDFVKLVDFGISKVRQPGEAALTQAGSALGTPLYMSPEQARSPRDVDLRSDLYSVGVILYELLTGRTPFTAESGELTELLFKIFTADPIPFTQLRPDLPTQLAAVVHQSLARDPAYRFFSAVDMADALSQFADSRSDHVLARLRIAAGRPSGPVHRFVAPPPMGPQAHTAVIGAARDSGLPGIAIGTGVMNAEAMARTALTGPPSTVLRTPARTSAGVARDAGQSGETAGKKPIGAIVAAVAVLGVVGVVGTWAALHGRGSKSAAGSDPTATTVPITAVTTAPPASTTAVATATAPASTAAALAPDAAATAMQLASPPTARTSVSPPRPPPPATTSHTNLGSLRPIE